MTVGDDRRRSHPGGTGLTTPTSDRRVRAGAAVILAAGILAAGLAILSEELGIGAAEAEGLFGWKRITLLGVGLAAAAIGSVLLARPGLASRVIELDDEPDPARRAVRGGAALVLAAGSLAAGLAILSEELGIGAAAAEGVFGWKRITLLGAGLVAAAIGSVLLARPGIVASRIDWEHLGNRWEGVSRFLRARRTAWEAPPTGSERIRSPAKDVASPADRQLRYLAIGLLALLGAVLIWTRLLYIDQGFWGDELWSVLAFSGVGPDAILFSSFNFNNHVLYNLLSWATVSLFGESEPMYRFWSVVPGIAAIGVVTWWAWSRLGPVVAVAFAAIAVAAPLHLHLAPEARGYGLALLAASLLLVAADRLTYAYSRLTLAGFVGAGLLGIWTLVIFAIAFVGQALALLRWRHLRLPVIVVLGTAAIISMAFYGFGTGRSPVGAAVGGETIPLSAALLLDRPLEWMVIPTITLLTGAEGRPWLDPSAPWTTEEARQSLFMWGINPSAPSVDWLDALALALYVVGLVALWGRGYGGLALLLLLPPLVFNLWLSLDQQATVVRHQFLLLPYVILPVAVAIAELGRLAARPAFLKPVVVAAGVALVLALGVETVKEGQGRAVPRESFKEAAEVVSQTGRDTVFTDTQHPAGFHYYLDGPLTTLSAEDTEARLCDQRGEFVYIRHINRPALQWGSWLPARLDCLADRAATRVRVPQRTFGGAIDVWIVGGTANQAIGDDLPYAREALYPLTETSPPVLYEFEEDMEGRMEGSDARAFSWLGTGASLSRATSHSRSGDASLEITTDGAGGPENEGATIKPPSIRVTPNTTYAASAWVRAPQGTPLDFRLSERDGQDASLDEIGQRVIGTGEWQFVRVVKDFGSQGARARVRVFSALPTEAITFHIDDVMLGPARHVPAGGEGPDGDQ